MKQEWRILLIIFLVVHTLFVFFWGYVQEPLPQTVLLSFDTETNIQDPATIENLLVILDERNISATFFVTGEFVEQYPVLAKEIYLQGHEVGCHSYNHSNFKKLSIEGQKMQVEKCTLLIKDVTGESPVGFRSPWRQITKETYLLLHENGYKYDASHYENWWGYFSTSSIKEIETSTLMQLPLDDISLLHYLHFSENEYFGFLLLKRGRQVSYSFHPPMIMQYEEGFETFLDVLVARNTMFLRHKDLLS